MKLYIKLQFSPIKVKISNLLSIEEISTTDEKENEESRENVETAIVSEVKKSEKF